MCWQKRGQWRAGFVLSVLLLPSIAAGMILLLSRNKVFRLSAGL